VQLLACIRYATDCEGAAAVSMSEIDGLVRSKLLGPDDYKS